ncbi:MAG TPA: TonB-dependent receptor [Gammaproteobacteria bacterium]|nr:TonB-dependent receptor [Gammaproteobacteria bacterium]
MTTQTTRILIAAALGITHPVLAQTADAQTADAPDTVERVIVTGARAPIDVGRLGSATTVITRDEIERRQARYLTDLLRTVPGFAVAVSGGVGSQAQARARGGEANHVLMLIDGVRANDPASADEFRWEHFATGNIERVEIVRGPQSALWGSEAIGAVVNVITRTGSGEPAIDGYAETGSNGSRNLGANAGGRLGGWTLGGSIESLEADGTNISRSGTEDDGASLNAATIRARHDGSDRVTLDAMLRANDATSEFDPVDFVVTGLPTDGNLESHSDNLVGSIRASIAASDDIAWHLDAQYYDSKHQNLVDDAWESSTASERVTYGFGADVRLGENELSLAIEHEDIDFEQRGAVVFGDPNQNQDVQIASAIAEYRWLAGERTTWILGGRYDSHSDFDDALTGRLSTAYRLTDRTRLRAGIGTGQKTPTFIERFGFFPQQFVGNRDLKPESSLSYDLGVDQEWLDGELSISASLYWQELGDEIDGFVFDPDTFLFTAENESMDSERRGLELAASWGPTEALSLGLDYTYTDATQPGAGGGTERELRRPRHSGGVSLSYGAPGGRFEAMLLADYGGKSADIFFPPFPEPEQRVMLADYWLVDATALFRLRPSLTLFARGTNLLDEDYEQVYGYATPGRAAYVGLRVDLGR